MKTTFSVTCYNVICFTCPTVWTVLVLLAHAHKYNFGIFYCTCHSIKNISFWKTKDDPSKISFPTQWQWCSGIMICMTLRILHDTISINIIHKHQSQTSRSLHHILSQNCVYNKHVHTISIIWSVFNLSHWTTGHQHFSIILSSPLLPHGKNFF